jgi:hypothetical protein
VKTTGLDRVKTRQQIGFSNYWRSKDAKLQLVKLMTKVFLLSEIIVVFY